MWAYIGISVGDLLSGIISQWLQSRRLAIIYMMSFSLIGVILLFLTKPTSTSLVYFYCTWLGFGTGYWAMFATVAAEQFGTNLRATAATTIPNMVRGALIPMNMLFAAFKPTSGVVGAATIVCILAYGIGLYCVWSISETHDKDLDYLEG